jgi:hypothetical protein
VATTRREDDRRVEETRRFRGYAFTLKDVTIPAVAFGVRARDGGAPRVTRSEPVRVGVRPVLDPKDPGPPEGPGAPPDDAPSWIVRLAAFLAALVAAVVVGILDVRRRPAGVPPSGVGAPSTPDARALAALAALLEAPPDDPDGVREDVGTIADVVRDFVAAQHGVRARRRTTPEILAAVRSAGGAHDALAEVLEPCDRTKFGAHAPAVAERDELIERAAAFVRQAAGEATS